VSSLVAQWWSGDYITWSKVYIKSWDIGRNRILSFHPPDTSERNIQILNDLIWAFRWLNGGLGIILHGQKCISSYQIYAGIEYCLSIHRIHRKEIQILNDLIWAFRWLNGGLGMILHGPKCILIQQTYAGIENPLLLTGYIGMVYSLTQWLNASILVAQWWSGDYIRSHTLS